jgi:hypothetical protein
LMYCIAFSRKTFGAGCQKQMGVIGHNDEGVKFKAVFVSLFLEDVEKENCVLFDLEEAATIGRDGCDEVGAEFLWSEWHGKEGPGLKPLQNCA